MTRIRVTKIRFIVRIVHDHFDHDFDGDDLDLYHKPQASDPVIQK